MVTVIYSDAFLEHRTGRLHPERPDRLTAAVKALQDASWGHRLQWQTPTPIADGRALAWVSRLHDREYASRVQQLAAEGGGMLDPDTAVSPQSYDVALLAVSAWLDGVDRAIATSEPVFVLARPPGHHAERRTGMGFCLFGNAAIAAHYALELSGVSRVAVLDWDVHHGNGTQALVEANPQIAYCSLHQFPCYPGTGTAGERGLHGNVLNVPLPPGSAIAAYREAFAGQVVPFLQQWQPDLLVISAGYDANLADPLASMALQPEDYGEFMQQVRDGLPQGLPIVLGLEGGYDLEALGRSVAATIAVCVA